MAQDADLDALLVFAVVAREGSFTRAAEILGLTQPSISDRMRRLEARLPSPAFERLGRGVRLTPTGEALRPVAERALNVARESGEILEGLSGFTYGRITTAASTTIAAHVLPDALARFARARPKVEVEIRVANTADVANAVERGDVSWGLVEGPVEEARLVARPFRDNALILIVPAAHRWARRRRPVAPADLAREAFVAREIGSGTGAVVERALAKAGVRLRPGLRLGDSRGIVEAIAAGAGVGIVSQLVAASLLEAGRVVRVPLAGVSLYRALSLIQLPGRSVGRLDAELLRLVGALY